MSLKRFFMEQISKSTITTWQKIKCLQIAFENVTTCFVPRKSENYISPPTKLLNLIPNDYFLFLPPGGATIIYKHEIYLDTSLK